MVWAEVQQNPFQCCDLAAHFYKKICRWTEKHMIICSFTDKSKSKITAVISEIKNNSNDKEFSPHLVRNLESSNQEVPSYLLELANQVAWFKNQRKKEENSNRKSNIGGRGLGYKERPSLGGKGSTSSQKSTSGGPQTDRAAALKQAFANQFKSQFVSILSSKLFFIFFKKIFFYFVGKCVKRNGF